MEKPLMYLKNKILFIGIIFVLLYSCDKKQSTSQDWPQFKKDNFRSANSSIQLDVTSLGEDWVYKASQMPSPAWYGPAKEDTYARSGPLPSMRDYDLSYYPIIVGSKLYYGSSSDNAIHCLDTKTGNEEWTFTTGGPIRVAPVFHSGNLYFGSDDGFAYCIKASNGKLIWEFSPMPEQPKKVLNNNSLISFWPIRTGLLIENDIAYFGASLLPWKDSYFCAINSKTGKPDIDGTYIKKYENLTLEGAMASTGTKIIQPQGRISPIIFDKKNGESKGQLAGTGGCFVLVTPEKNIVHSESTRDKSISETFGDLINYSDTKEEKTADFMSYKGGKEMVVKDSTSYILNDNSISAYNRNSKKVIWLKRNYKAHRMIISNDILYIGATDTVYAVSTKNGMPLWKTPVKGAVYALAVADNALFASTGEGNIYCFREGKNSNTLFAENNNLPPTIDKEEKLAEQEKEENNVEFVAGPFVTILGPNSIEINFITENSEKCSINWGDDSGKIEIIENAATTNHKIVVENIRKNFIYQYQIVANGAKTKFFEFDNFFNYTHQKPIKEIDNTIEKEFITKLKNLNPSQQGLCVLFGAENEGLSIEIAEQTDMKVMLFEASKSKVNDLKNKWQKTGIYGGSITAHHIDDLSNLPLTGDVAQLVIVTDETKIAANEVIRIIKPNGHALLVNEKSDHKDWLAASESIWQVEQINTGGSQYLKKNPIESSGVWTHQYGLADNSAFGGESLWGSTSTDDFEIQWMGRPGPRFQTDRSGRKPAPLAINSKMFVQGNERILAVDAYDGKIYWSKEIPGMVRMNLLHDCSNWAADNDFIYVVQKNNLLKIDNTNGEINQIIPVEKSKYDVSNEWGYVGVLENSIIGSSVQKGSAYTNFYGGEGWYDAQTGPATFKVVSFSLFSKSKDGKTVHWKYEKPSRVIINSTITIVNDQISFVESRNPKLELSEEGRGKSSLFKNLYLVSLNTKTGKLNWEKKLDNEPGITTYFMAGSNNFNVIVSSYRGSYYIYNYKADSGKLVWKTTQPWFSGDHGGHLSRPAIVNNKLIIKPAIYALDSGVKLLQEIPKAGHGCASYALTEQSAFYRGGSVTQFNFDTNKFSKWERLRPDCWISTIPAQGLILSPEAGGGCSCGNWLETSMVFSPISRAPISFIFGEEKFIDSVSIEIKSRDLSKNEIYYTLDGSIPSNKSKKYKEPIVIDKNIDLNAIVYVEKNGKPVSFIRTKQFERLRPSPKIADMPQLTDDKWKFTINPIGTTGEIHYTTDGTTPNRQSPRYKQPVHFTEKIILKAKSFWNDNGNLFESTETSAEIPIPILIDNLDVQVKPGIKRNYYENSRKEAPNFSTIEPTKTTIAKVINLDEFNGKEKFALRFNGYIHIPQDGVYTFTNESEGESIIYFHNKKSITNNNTITLVLKKGYHNFAIDYYIWRGNPKINLQIEGPNMPKQTVSSDQLFY